MSGIEAIEEEPLRDSLINLADFQSETPTTFFGQTPVLHFHSSSTIIIAKADLEENELFKKLENDTSFDWVEAEAEGEEAREIATKDVHIWALSTNLVIFSKGSAGISIPYPSIALHAKGSRRSATLPTGEAEVVYLQLNVHDTETINSDDEIQTVDLSIVPSLVEYPPRDPVNGAAEAVSDASLLFEALSACANLHPDPQSDDEQDPVPGDGGWITAENMADFMDENGNFTGMGSLGPGAGTVRTREDNDDDDHDDEDEKVNGDDNHEESKWRRTD